MKKCYFYNKIRPLDLKTQNEISVLSDLWVSNRTCFVWQRDFSIVRQKEWVILLWTSKGKIFRWLNQRSLSLNSASSTVFIIKHCQGYQDPHHRRYQQRLGDITQEEIGKEGYNGLEEFKQAWININGTWNPNEVVTVVEVHCEYLKSVLQLCTYMVMTSIRIDPEAWKATREKSLNISQIYEKTLIYALQKREMEKP